MPLIERARIDSSGRFRRPTGPTVMRLQGSPPDGFLPHATPCGLANDRVHVKPAGGPPTEHRGQRREHAEGAPRWGRLRRVATLEGGAPPETVNLRWRPSLPASVPLPRA